MSNQNPFDQGYYQADELRKMGFKSVGKNVQIAKNCTIIGLENISMGDNVRIDDGVTIACARGYLKIGSYVHIAGNSHLACAGGITFSDFSGASQGVRIYSGSDDYSGKYLNNSTIPKEFRNVSIKPIVFGRYVIIGSGSVVLPGVIIAEGSCVGALSLVTKSLESWGVYFGVPAKKIKRRKNDLLEQEKLLLIKRGSKLPKL